MSLPGGRYTAVLLAVSLPGKATPVNAGAAERRDPWIGPRYGSSSFGSRRSSLSWSSLPGDRRAPGEVPLYPGVFLTEREDVMNKLRVKLSRAMARLNRATDDEEADRAIQWLRIYRKAL